MENGKLGVAIHGAGWVAGAHTASWLKNPFVQVVSISDVAKDRARQLADRHDLDCSVRDCYEEVLRDDRVDVIDITGPSCVHAQQAMAAAEAGKHLLVEKPHGTDHRGEPGPSRRGGQDRGSQPGRFRAPLEPGHRDHSLAAEVRRDRVVVLCRDRLLARPGAFASCMGPPQQEEDRRRCDASGRMPRAGRPALVGLRRGGRGDGRLEQREGACSSTMPTSWP